VTRRRAGRPRGGQERVNRDEILRVALDLLDSEGAQQFSMRSLARALKVNPMTLYHHVGDHAELLRAVSDRVYADVAHAALGDGSASVRKKVERLLLDYFRVVQRHPQVTLSIFAHPEAFSREAERITQSLGFLLEAAEFSPARARVWLGILVDYTHGSSLATAMSRTGWGEGDSEATHVREFSEGLRELLDGLFGEG
jgi:AcrR family transcriptional regulator